jgi:hypothetical protein
LAQLTVQSDGAINWESADVAGDTFDNKYERKVLIKNDDASAKDITLTAQKPCQLGVLHDHEVTVGAGETLLMADLPIKFYNDENGMAELNYSDVTSLSVAVLDV